jgi:hypothetical protein
MESQITLQQYLPAGPMQLQLNEPSEPMPSKLAHCPTVRLETRDSTIPSIWPHLMAIGEYAYSIDSVVDVQISDWLLDLDMPRADLPQFTVRPG